MKKIYTLGVILVISFNLPAQDFIERSFQTNLNSGFGASTKDSLGNIFIVSNSGFAFSSPAIITKINLDGKIAYNNSLGFLDITTFLSIIRTYDNNLVICGYIEGCDWFPSQFGLILKYDPAGSLIWNKTINPDTSISFPSDNVLRNITELSNKHLVVHGDSTLYYLSTNGDSLWSKVFTSSIRSLSSQDLNILMGIDSFLMVLDTMGTIINQKSFPSLINKFEKLSDTLYLLSAGNILYTLDTALTIINQVNLNGINFQANVITSDDNHVCISNSQGTGFACFDHSLSITDTFRIQSGNVSCSSLELRDTLLYIFGKEWGQNSKQYYKSLSIYGGYDYHETDVSITAIQFDTAYAYHPSQLPTGVHSFDFMPIVTVKNQGNDTLQDVIINSMKHFNGICGPAYNIERFYGMNIPPGESLDITLMMHTEYGWMFTPPLTYSFCAWTSCPDSMTDKNHSNDYWCDSFVITGIVSVKELENINFSIYPNPVSEELNVILQNQSRDDEKYFINNSFGQLVDNGLLGDGRINISKLAEGVYIIHIQSHSKNSARKFVKAKS